jgi:hypothetical protein
MERYRFHADGAIFYVPFTLVDWLPVFVSPNRVAAAAKKSNAARRRALMRG